MADYKYLVPSHLSGYLIITLPGLRLSGCKQNNSKSEQQI